MLKQVQHDWILVQISAKIGTKVQKKTSKSQRSKQASNSRKLNASA
jgi:hypothetical protein